MFDSVLSLKRFSGPRIPNFQKTREMLAQSQQTYLLIYPKATIILHILTVGKWLLQIDKFLY